MRVLLSHTDKHNRLACRMYHVDRSANFLIDSIELGQNDAINGPRVVIVDSEVDQRLVELCQLIDSVVAYERFADEKNDVWRVDMDQFG